MKKSVTVIYFILFIFVVFMSIAVVKHFVFNSNEISAEMLEGDWSCKTIGYKAIYENDKFTDYMVIQDSVKNSIVKFRNKNGELFRLKEDNSSEKATELITNNNKTVLEEDEHFFTRVTHTISKNLNNEIIITAEIIITSKDDKYQAINLKEKGVFTCVKKK